MRIAVRILLGLAVLVVLLGVGVALLLPPLARSEAVRERLHTEARAALGREVNWEELDLGLLPPRLVVRGAVVGDPSAGPSFQASEVALEVALLPLFARVLLVDSVRIEGAQLRVVRTEAGLLHPFAPPAGAASDSEPGSTGELGVEAEAPTAAGGDELSFAVRRVTLGDARVSVRDETRSPPLELALEDLGGSAEAALTRGAMDVDFSGQVETGGALRIHGSIGLSGGAVLTIDLEDVRIEPAAVYAAAGTRLVGGLSGQVEFKRQADRDSLDLALVLSGSDLGSSEAGARGELRLEAQLESLDPVAGSVLLDAGKARLHGADQFVKEPGLPASVRGRISQRGDVFELRKGSLRLGEIASTLSLRVADTTSLTLGDAQFDASDLAAFLPAVAKIGAAGPVAISSLTLTAEPFALDGEVQLQPLTVAVADAPQLIVRGSVRFAGTRAVAEGLEVRVAGEPFAVDATLYDLAGELRVDTRVRAERVDSQKLARAFDPDFDRIEGPLSLDGRLRGPLAGPRPLADVATGRLRFEIAPGRIAGVSLLREAFSDPRETAVRSLLGSREQGLARYGEDTFESLSATVDVRGGRAHTDDLRLVYQHYTVDLEGTVGLTDRALDLTGELTVDPSIDETLAGEGSTGRGRKRVFPLAKVTGTLDAPRVVLGEDAIFRLGSAYIRDERRRSKWEKKIDERIGEGAGKEVLDALDQILRGGGRR